MNRVILMGRLTREPEIKQTQAGKAVARYTLAVDRFGDGADFISCVTFEKGATFAQNFLHKGTKIAIEGHIQTGSYTKQDGTKVYTTDVIVDRHEFCESKQAAPEPTPENTDFMAVDPADDSGLPWN